VDNLGFQVNPAMFSAQAGEPIGGVLAPMAAVGRRRARSQVKEMQTKRARQRSRARALELRGMMGSALQPGGILCAVVACS
jgi:hypothetical protein